GSFVVELQSCPLPSAHKQRVTNPENMLHQVCTFPRYGLLSFIFQFVHFSFDQTIASCKPFHL
ncbi:MAG TPA: hypothetical protein VFK47_20945, partial [Ktedonobacteraceae bacterium]|nr:hypothetical protein [Ktedonobacteraceae bacterium]